LVTYILSEYASCLLIRGYSIHVKQVLSNKIELLSQEATGLINELDELDRRRQMIEVRLHQIAGAIQELDSLLQGESHETK
jgi:hypothetical protein